MALSEDSRSLLQLLLARKKSYGDIAELLGVEPSEVRQRARAALGEISGGDPDQEANLTDYLLGQADAIDRAETARVLNSSPYTRETALEIRDQLKLLVPEAELPKIDATAGSLARDTLKRPSPFVPSDGGAGKQRFPANLSSSQRNLLAILVSAALLVVIVVVVIGALGGEGNGDEMADEPAPTTAVLRPVNDQSGRGRVDFGVSRTGLAANLEFNGLEPTEQGQSYTLWLSGPQGSFPIDQARVNDSGAISNQIPLNLAVVCLIAGDLFPDMRLSRVNDDEMRRVLRESRQANRNNEQIALPEFVGRPVLRGPISMPQEAKDSFLPTCTGQTPS